MKETCSIFISPV